MEPRAFIKVSVLGLGLRIPVASKASRTGVHAASSPCFCEISLPNSPVQTVPVTLLSPTTVDADTHTLAASFYLDEPALQKLLTTSCCNASPSFLKVVVFSGRQGSCCRVRTGKKLGTFKLPVGIEWTERKSVQLHNGWTSIGRSKGEGRRPGAELHVIVKVEPDPRYVFQFDGEPALSPQIVQVQGNMRQPIFSCKFSRDRSSRSRLGPVDVSAGNGWSGSGTGDSSKERKERKGWLVMIHDLSGSPVAAASMVTPFVPSAGSDLVSRSNPGAWLILRPEPSGVDSWRPWGRLEAWRERGRGVVGCKFTLNQEGGGVAGVSSGVLIAEAVLNAQKGGEFLIDTGRLRPEGSSTNSPIQSPKSSGEFSFTHVLPSVGGFVMKCNVKGEKSSIKPVIQLAMRHVTCVEDAAVFMALAAAVDLSVDACQPFSRKLRTELSHPSVPS
ncbi:hypothetical protein MPTK1_3g09520 [Marchantia polymorpha subsp. ruderalis]|uniref:Uncharacterized protein n=2 Tax=Marchantia polymorpha TaxID=3197 RepID=A0A176WIR1_MARPO|nr:hypothetical protein AXG93_862s1020 [Marchantia polymorpha subsp. ruderalis]PTQ33865.1 hypothetical protein MARPO_0085s0075 [Marchantia polymorpha]BBN05011.1 hypothetical protein Mp_3g09520 [Marchantia polymorpha subsp. ruderalis]|eukprot:PTQ33865.1 hypothetical protein MARPO_0085s0075 [Marchantia polymorpha]